MLPFWMMKASRDMAMSLGYNRYEISWVLEANKAMTHIAENVGGTHYKTYRVYEKAL